MHILMCRKAKVFLYLIISFLGKSQGMLQGIFKAIKLISEFSFFPTGPSAHNSFNWFYLEWFRFKLKKR